MVRSASITFAVAFNLPQALDTVCPPSNATSINQIASVSAKSTPNTCIVALRKMAPTAGVAGGGSGSASGTNGDVSAITTQVPATCSADSSGAAGCELTVPLAAGDGVYEASLVVTSDGCTGPSFQVGSL